MYLLMLNVMDADPGMALNASLTNAFIYWVYQHIDTLKEEARRGNIDIS